MAAPSGTVWGSIVDGTSSGRKGRLGIHVSLKHTDTKTTATVQVWFWTIYSCSDVTNTFYFNIGQNITSASTSKGAVSISHSIATGEGWNTANQTKLTETTYTASRAASAASHKIYASLAGIDILNGTVYANTSFTVPALPTYTISYNANGGSGAPAPQTKTHDSPLTISRTEPTRTGYSFAGWAMSKSEADSPTDDTWYYPAGGTFSASENRNVTLYAAWRANTYVVKYNANGGSGAPANQTKTHGVSLTLSSVRPTRTNYNFLGWGTSASATTVSYMPGSSYSTNAGVTLYAVWSLAYRKPRITNYTVSRCDGNGLESDSGEYVRVRFAWACDQTLSSIVVETISGTNEVISNNISASGTSGSIDTVVGGTLSSELTYTVRAIVTDASDYTSISRPLPGTRFVIDFLSGGRGVAFGKPAQTPDYVDFGWDAHFDNNLRIRGRDLDGNIKEVFQPVNSNGNTVIGWGHYDARSGNTNIYGHDIYMRISNIADPSKLAAYTPYVRRDQSLTFSNLRTAGYVTNAGKDVTFLVPFAVPILGSPTVTAASISGFVLRQNTQYTHGSGASTYVVPDSYTTAISTFCGVYVVAHFSNTTNVVNNAPIGIYWSGTLTFT